jgi:hypothetical protein
MASQPRVHVQWDPFQHGSAVLELIALAVAGFWPVLNAHPLMDDHLFFSWLERTPWRDALWQRLTANWIPDFPQLQMYRPVSGLWQVITYHFFRASALPHHLLNLLLHGGTCLLAGVLACNLTGNRKAGWLVSGLMLVHPRAALGVSLIFNFTDVLSAFLMMLSLVVLYAIRRDKESWSCLKIPPQKGGKPLTPGPSPRWGEGNPPTVPPCTRGDLFDSLAPIGGEGGRRPGEGASGNRDTSMHNDSSNHWTVPSIVLSAVFLLAPISLFAQCSMCNAVASAQSAGAAHALNRAILVLLIPPVVIMGTILIWAFKYRNSSTQS